MPLSDIACPHCGQMTRVNVAAKPKSSFFGDDPPQSFQTPCRHCKGPILVTSSADGTHTITKRDKPGVATVKTAAGWAAVLGVAALMLGGKK